MYVYANGNPVNWVDCRGLAGKWSGNWCGADWSGGFPAPYDPLNDVFYVEPIDDGNDECCKAHDICFFECRRNHPCDKGKRYDCMKECNVVLRGCADSRFIKFGMRFPPDEGEDACGCESE